MLVHIELASSMFNCNQFNLNQSQKSFHVAIDTTLLLCTLCLDELKSYTAVLYLTLCHTARIKLFQGRMKCLRFS